MTALVPARRPTLRRWRRLSTARYSIYRALEYEALDGVVLGGRTLDVGGGRHNSYYHLLHVDGTIDSVNIDERVRPTVVADLDRPLPFRDATFDNVVCLNTLEHVHDEHLAIRELLRVLRCGGTFHIGVPFLYRVHASPADYHRHTAAWWCRTLAALGVDPRALTIEPLVWEPLASAFSLVEFTRLRRLLKKPVMLAGVLLEAPHGREERMAPLRAERASSFALGWYVRGTAP